MADSLACPGRKVKVYVLNEVGDWDDRGTGHVHLEKQNEAYVIKVLSESTSRVTFCSQVHPLRIKSAYQMQGETIISWLDPDLDNTEVALSFAEPDGCRDTWTKLCDLENTLSQSSSAYTDAPSTLPASFSDQHPASGSLASNALSLPLSVGSSSNDPSDALVSHGDSSFSSALDSGALHRAHHSSVTGNHIALVDAASAADITHPSRFFGDALDNTPPWNSDPIDDGMFRDSSSVFFLSASPVSFLPQGSSNEMAVTPSNFTMPEPSRAGLDALYQTLSDQNIIHFAAAKERIISQVLNSDYVPKLCQVFRACEEKADFDSLGILYHVTRCLFTLGSGNVLEVMVREDNLMDIVGCLEYDPDRKADIKQRYEEAKSRSGSAKSSKKGVTDLEIMNADSAALQMFTSISCDRDDTVTQERGVGEKEPERDEVEAHQSNLSDVNDSSLRSPDQKLRACKDERCKATSTDANVEINSEVANHAKGTKGNTEDGKGTNSQVRSGSVKGDDDDDSSLASCEQKIENSGPKNLSEETTSSGNLVREDGERRFVVRVHRDFLERKVSYKSVVRIQDPSVIAKIHQNYRVAYIRDVILARLFDESVNSALTNVIVYNNVDIIMYFISGSSALKDLFDRMKNTILQRKNIRDRRKHTRTRRGVATRGAAGVPVANTGQLNLKTTAVQFSGEDSNRSGERLGRRRTDGAQLVDKHSSIEMHSPKTSSNSRVTCTTTGSNTTAAVEPSTSKDLSCRELFTYGSKCKRSADFDQDLSEKAEQVQENLCSMLGFLRELCSLAKGQQLPVKNRFHTMLRALGVLDMAVHVLQDEDPTLRVLCCEVLSAVIGHDQTDVRSHMLNGTAQPPEKKPPRRLGIALRSAPLYSVNQSDRKKDEAKRIVRAKSDQTSPRKQEDKSSTGESNSSLDLASTAKAREVEERDNDAKDSGLGAKRLSKIDLPISVKRAMRSLRQRFIPSFDRSRSESDLSTGAADGDLSNGSGQGVYAATDIQLNSKSVTSEETAQRILAIVDGSARDSANAPKNFDELFVRAPPRYGSCPILGAMVAAIVEDRESGIVLSILDLLRTLLDPSNMRTDKEAFLDKFYGEYMNQLLTPIQRCAELYQHQETDVVSSGWNYNANHVCDLLSYCVVNHAYRGKYFVLSFDVGTKIAALFRHPNVHIRLSALRFIRACVCLDDNGIDRYLVRCKLLSPMLEMFKYNGYRDNLVGSAVLEVIATITHSRRLELLKCVVEEYGSLLEPSERYCGAFTDAKRKLEELKKACARSDICAEALVTAGDGPTVTLKTHEDTQMSPVEGTELVDGASGVNYGAEDEGSSHEYRFVRGLFGHDLQIPPGEDRGERFFAHSAAEDKVMEDLQSFLNSERDEEMIPKESKVDSFHSKPEGSLTAHRSSSAEVAGSNDAKEEGRLESGSKDMSQKLKGDDNIEELGLGAKLVKKKAEGCKLAPARTAKYPSKAGNSGEGGLMTDAVSDGACVESNTGKRNRVARDRSLRISEESSSGNSTGKGHGRLRLSMCKSDRKQVKMSDGDEINRDDVICESSEESRWPRKRGRSHVGRATRSTTNGGRQGRRWTAESGIETCTQAVMGSIEDAEEANAEELKNDELGSPSKRRCTESTENRDCDANENGNFRKGREEQKETGQSTEDENDQLRGSLRGRGIDCEEGAEAGVTRMSEAEAAGKRHVMKGREEELECCEVETCRGDEEIGSGLDFGSRTTNLDGIRSVQRSVR